MSRRKHFLPGAPVVVCRKVRTELHVTNRSVWVHRGLDRAVWRAIWNDKRRADAGRWHSGART